MRQAIQPCNRKSAGSGPASFISAHTNSAKRHFAWIFPSTAQPPTGALSTARRARPVTEVLEQDPGRSDGRSERENGRIFCQAREAKYGRREMNDAPHLHRSEWKLWQEISKENAFDPECHRALEAGEWQTLKQRQKQERIDFWKQTGQMRKDLRGALREEVREEFQTRCRPVSPSSSNGLVIRTSCA
jgi:hypothetical protein